MSKVVDFRSDTVTQPDATMRRVMAEAVVGDDVYGEDPSTNALQQQTAELLGKEAGLFVPTGTMANLIAVLAHSWGRGGEIILGDRSHIFLYEQGGAAQVGGVHSRSIPNLLDGTFSISSLKAAFRNDDLHYPITTLVCIENTHNMMGGKVLPLAWLDEVASTCKEMNVPIHLDGARLLNAAVALNVPPTTLTKHCNSVSLCLSKGLGAPVGSVLVGDREFIQRATRLRKLLGGGMRQCGILAAAGTLALARYQATLATDHTNAKTIAQAVRDAGSERVTVNLEAVHTNIVMLDCNIEHISPAQLENKLKETQGSENDVSILAFAVSPTQVRLVTHCNLSPGDIAIACEKIIKIIK